MYSRDTLGYTSITGAAVTIPSGDTASRPTVFSQGMIRLNTGF